MWVRVNGVRLYFDVEGAGLVPDGPRMRKKPTLVLLHGGPGFDHSIYKPGWSSVADVAQVVFLDHRGNGRSEAGPQEAWTLAQWGDDVRAFCDALGIERPIVYGASFGGTVALAYATRHPTHPARLILVSTEAAADTHRDRRVALFERFGGPEVGALAVRRPEVTRWFLRPGGEGHTFDMFPDLSRVQCPTLILGGEDDPMVPIECQADIAAALPAPLCASSDSLDAGMRCCPMRGNARWR